MNEQFVGLAQRARHAAKPAKNVDVDLRRVNELKLMVTDGGDAANGDWAVWGDPSTR